jgi:hypothetical protein
MEEAGMQAGLLYVFVFIVPRPVNRPRYALINGMELLLTAKIH